MKTTTISEPVNHARMREAEELLTRYPDVTDDESLEILVFMKKAPALEVGLLSCKDHLKLPIERFRQDHRGEFELDWRRLGGFWLVTALIFTAAGLIWFMLS